MTSDITRSKWKLRDVILEHSISDDFIIASREWTPIWIDEDETCESECICGKKHIKELNAIEHNHSGTVLIVGSECINYFIDLDTTNVFKRLAEIKKDYTKPMTPKLLTAISRLNILNDWELNFYFNTSGKRKPSKKVMDVRIRINKKVISAIRARRNKYVHEQNSGSSILTDEQVCEALGI